MLAAVEGEVQVVFGGVAASRPLAASGKLRALGITGAVRSPIMPDVPTVAEAAGLKEFEGGTTWEGIVAPANTPPEIVRKVRDDVATVLRSEDVNRKLSALGFIIVAGSSEQFGERISSDIVKWHKILGDMGVKPQ